MVVVVFVSVCVGGSHAVHRVTEDPYWAQLHTPECFLRVLGDATALATKSEVIVSRAPLANASVMEGYIASALDKLNTTYLSASPAVLHDRGQTGVADSRFPLVVVRRRAARPFWCSAYDCDWLRC
mgnify:CR=1 FL=1